VSAQGHWVPPGPSKAQILAMVSVMQLQELVDAIVSYFSKDSQTSRACALVCRSWAHPARRNLFHSIRLRFIVSKTESFLDLLQSNPALGAYIREVYWDLPRSASNCPIDSQLTVSLFLRLAALSNEHATIHKITIDMLRDQERYLLGVLDRVPDLIPHIKWVRWGCRNGSREWENSEAQLLASKLHSIQDLTLAQWGSFPFVPTVPFQVIGEIFRPTSITTLTIENLVFTNGSQFQHFVHAFTALQDLSYHSMEWVEDTATIWNKTSPKAPPLRCIALGRSQPAVSTGTVQWLLDQPVVPPLTTIHVSENVPSEMNELVQRCASSIIDLTCSGKQVVIVHAQTNIISHSLPLQPTPFRLMSATATCSLDSTSFTCTWTV
jgi:hypothetical protein